MYIPENTESLDLKMLRQSTKLELESTIFQAQFIVLSHWIHSQMGQTGSIHYQAMEWSKRTFFMYENSHKYWLTVSTAVYYKCYIFS